MPGISNKTMRQLVKEFWIPFLAAAVWTGYAVWEQPLTVKSVIAAFGPSFFLASWMTGQIFRVRKQAGVESSLTNVESRLENVVTQLEAKSLQMINHVTGGDSFCFLMPFRTIGNNASWLALHSGDYPLYQVNVRILDLEAMVNTPQYRPDDDAGYAQYLNIGDMPCGSRLMYEGADLRESGDRSFNIFINARNGRIFQEVRFKRVEDGMAVAYRVKRNDILLEEVIPPQLLDEEGRFDWAGPPFSFDMSKDPNTPNSPLRSATI
ncbi:hypothetical protein ACIPQ1_08975 [Pseudomonas sp. LARHCG127]